MLINNIFVVLFLVGTAFSLILNQTLNFSAFRARKKHGTRVPTELFGYTDTKTLSKTCEYRNAHYFLGIPADVLSTVVGVALLCGGFYAFLYNRLSSALGNEYLTVLLFTLLSSIPSMLLDLPFELYGEFSIEKRFGFSNMTVKQWILDSIKSALVSAVISVPLLLAAVFLLRHVPSLWWLLLGAIYLAFSLGVSFLYPLVVAPLFNKFSPLPNGDLKKRLESLLEKSGFKAEGIYVMDASRRSSHSNAYFTGFGKSKRVVLYDTLINQLSIDEMESVLAHELGHYKHGHIIKRMCFMIPVVFGVLFALSLVVQNPLLYTGFGFSAAVGEIGAAQKFIGSFLAVLVFTGFSPIVSLIANTMSRRDEFQADEYSAKACGRSRSLVTALIKLGKENLSDVTPPKVYTLFKYSHPPLLERIRHLQQL